MPPDDVGSSDRIGVRPKDTLSPLRSLAESWREDAARFRQYGAEKLAAACDLHADALEERLRAWRLEALTLEEAARESGLAYDTVQRKVGEEIPNAGEKGSPRVRRCDLLPYLQAPSSDDVGPVEELAEKALRAREA